MRLIPMVHQLTLNRHYTHRPLDPYIVRSHFATTIGSNRTQVPMRNDGMRPALACLNTVIRETANTCASSSAVKA